jgi:hypothetical protein
LVFDPDCEGVPIKGRTQKDKRFIADKIDEIWATASHCHFNRDFRFNSQSTSMQFTPRKAMGGRAWLSISLETAAKEKALVLWGNSTLGMLMYWWRANKQQSGRGSIAVGALKALPVLNVNELSAKQLAKAVEIFDRMQTRRLLPLNEIDRDENRHEIDRLLAVDVLGLAPWIIEPDGPLDLLRRKLAIEPSVHGAKKSQTELLDDDEEE